LIKVDVDGMELDLLRDALATIHRTRPILYVENDREAKSDDLLHFIAPSATTSSGTDPALLSLKAGGYWTL
jgi:hypothetical protein